MSQHSLHDLLFFIALLEGRYTHPLSMAKFQAQVYSQNGEDGIIAEIFRRIGTQSRIFVEIGVESGQQSNTRLLLEHGWSGVWIEANVKSAGRARSVFSEFVASGQLTVVEAAADPENIELLLEGARVPKEFDLLSLDIDYGTSHLWRGLRRRSRAACIEYNAALPPSAALEVPYDPARTWDGTSWFGASLKTLEYIGKEKGLSLVGCDLIGVNAFFVNSAEAEGRFQAPFTAESHWEPMRLPMVQHLGHPAPQEARRWVEC